MIVPDLKVKQKQHRLSGPRYGGLPGGGVREGSGLLLESRRGGGVSEPRPFSTVAVVEVIVFSSERMSLEILEFHQVGSYPF